MSRIQPDLEESMNIIARALNEIFKPYGFALLVFQVGDTPDGRMNYISNAKREDMIVALKEFIAKAEGRSANAPTTMQ